MRVWDWLRELVFPRRTPFVEEETPEGRRMWRDMHKAISDFPDRDPPPTDDEPHSDEPGRPYLYTLPSPTASVSHVIHRIRDIDSTDLIALHQAIFDEAMRRAREDLDHSDLEQHP